MSKRSQVDQQAIRYGVVGTGMMGIEHVHNILAMDGCVVTAVADPHEPSLDEARISVGEHAPPATFSTVDALLDAGLCDALVIASPNHTHHDVLVPAIESGLHVLIEKPLCTTMQDCRHILDLAVTRPPEQVIWMGLEYRYMPPVKRLLAEIDEGTVGDVKMVAIREHRFPFLEKVGDWNRFNRNTGGTLVEKTCHFFDLMMQITNSRPVRVFASGNQDVNHLDESYDGETPDILDNAFVVVDFDNGSRGMLDLCMFAEASKNEREISVVGTGGKLEALDTESVLRVGIRTPDVISGINVVHEETITDADIKHVGLHHGASYLEHVDFAAAIRSGRPAAVTVLDGLWAAAVGVAAHRSLDTGQPVMMDDIAELAGLELARVTAGAPLTELVAGQQLVYGGDRVATVDADLATAFRPGDRLVVVQSDGALLHIPATEHATVAAAVTAAVNGFGELAACSDDAITAFFDRFAALLDDDAAFAPIEAANAADVERARAKGRSTTRLELSASMRVDMVDGLRGWRDSPPQRDIEVCTIDHGGWLVEARRAPLGVVGFVFEGRPNVFADACGVVRTGNAVVFRIGSDALGTARAIVQHALRPALAAAGLPAGVVQLVDSAARSAGHALFSDSRLALAVARGSGAAVAQLGAVASQSGVPVSLHGTGGAWIVAGDTAVPQRLATIVEHSLDRKVCNTLNVCAIPAARAAELVPALLDGLDRAGANRDTTARLHVIAGSETFVPAERFERRAEVVRADGSHDEPFASTLPEPELATEWEWEHSPEVTLVVVDDVADAVRLFNEYSPHFTASLISADADEHEWFYAAVDAPFVGNGFTRWVDGQYALNAPELGLSNWQGGRMLGRGAILSGDSVHTVRYRAVVSDDSTHR